MLRIPLMYIKDKQAFAENGLTLLGNPVDLAKRLKADGYKLVHIIDQDALKGLSTNLDVYDKLTYVINIEVECRPTLDLVRKLLSLRCRVVLAPSALDISGIEEKNLLIAKITPEYTGPLDDFHDVLIRNADSTSIKRFSEAGKRVIVYEKDKKPEEKVWGVILSSCPSFC